MTPIMLYSLIGGGMFLLVLLIGLLGSSDDKIFARRLERVGPNGAIHNITHHQRLNAVKRSNESSIIIINALARLLPNPDKIRSKLARTGKNITLGEYLLMNLLAASLTGFILYLLQWNHVMIFFTSLTVGLGLPHSIISFMGDRRIKKFLDNFPEAIDTMCRGLRSGIPVTESIAAVGREMPEPIGTEFHRISDGVHMGKTVSAAMWEVAKRIDVPEFRFLIIAMAIQKETGGNLAQTIGNLADLIRKRRQLRMKIRAMSAEAKASAMIIGSLPFIMFILLMVVSPDYMGTMLHDIRGKILLGCALTWMSIGWGTMLKMISFEL